jgi:hypothetical protein
MLANIIIIQNTAINNINIYIYIKSINKVERRDDKIVR